MRDLTWGIVPIILVIPYCSFWQSDRHWMGLVDNWASILQICGWMKCIEIPPTNRDVMGRVISIFSIVFTCKWLDAFFKLITNGSIGHVDLPIGDAHDSIMWMRYGKMPSEQQAWQVKGIGKVSRVGKSIQCSFGRSTISRYTLP